LFTRVYCEDRTATGLIDTIRLQTDSLFDQGPPRFPPCRH
jgi:hypothetical protein